MVRTYLKKTKGTCHSDKCLSLAGAGLAVTVADVLSAPSTASSLTNGGILAAFSSLFGRRSLRFESCVVEEYIRLK